MAIKLWQENNEWHYSVDGYARSGTNRSNKAQRSAKGNLGAISQEKAESLVRHIERTLYVEANQVVALKDANGITWGELLQKWKADEVDEIPDPEFVRRSQKSAEGHYQRAHDFTTMWMKRATSSITPADVETVLRSMKALGYSDSTRYNAKVAIKQVFDWGIKRRLVPGMTASPTIGFSISRKNSRRPEILTHEDACNLVEKSEMANHPWSPVWKGALYSGARSGELQELRCGDLDQDARLINLERQWNSSTRRIDDLKDGEWRHVPINEELHELFVELDAYNRPKDEFVFPQFAAWKNGTQALVLRTFCDSVAVPSICFHTLRAIWATQLLRNQVDRLTVQKMGGWASVDAMEHYIRLAGIDVSGATDSLSFKRKRGRPARVLKLVGSGA